MIYEGNCIEILPKIRIWPDLIVTSPPYGKIRDFGGHEFNFDKVAETLVSYMKAGSVLVWVVADQIIDGNQTGESFRQALVFKELGLKLHDTIIYTVKGRPGITWPTRHTPGYQYMFIFANEKPKSFNPIPDVPTIWDKASSPTRRQPDGTTTKQLGYKIPDYVFRTNVWTYDPGFNKAHPGYPQAHQHPATFPYKLAADHIKTWTNPGDLVLDPMCGSGTTIRAALDLNRGGVGIEIHKPYVELARARLGQSVFELDIT